MSQFLLFFYDTWDEAVTLGLVLTRKKEQFHVFPKCKFMFGKDRVFDKETTSLDLGHINMKNQREEHSQFAIIDR